LGKRQRRWFAVCPRRDWWRSDLVSPRSWPEKRENLCFTLGDLRAQIRGQRAFQRAYMQMFAVGV
jgi:hypothetical protein